MKQALKKKGVLHKFYLVAPRPNINSDALAERIIMLEPVEEVFLTEGDYGFIIKTRFFNGEEPKDIARYISRNVGSRFGKVVSHCTYSK